MGCGCIFARSSSTAPASSMGSDSSCPMVSQSPAR